MRGRVFGMWKDFRDFLLRKFSDSNLGQAQLQESLRILLVESTSIVGIFFSAGMTRKF